MGGFYITASLEHTKPTYEAAVLERFFGNAQKMGKSLYFTHTSGIAHLVIL
ncbi:MAG: hypothetical protein ACJAVV_002848 [Alphaproteobacteria bacterium]|jgi:hypothetical protein